MAYPPFASTSTSHAYLAAAAAAAAQQHANYHSPPASLAHAHSNGHSTSRYQSPPHVYGLNGTNSGNHGASGSSGPLPAPPPFVSPREPAPLFDSNESALLSSFLTTLDVDPNFLFNPVLPPGMPSPPDDEGVTSGLDARDRYDREQEQIRLARGLGGRSGSAGGSRRIATLPDSGDEDETDAPDDVPIKDETDDDPDFEPSARGSGAGAAGRGGKRRGGKAAAGAAGANGKGGKKARGRASQTAAAVDEDAEMAGSNDQADDGSTGGGGVTASGRPRRNARPPRRLSSSNGPASPAASRTPRSAATKSLVAPPTAGLPPLPPSPALSSSLVSLPPPPPPMSPPSHSQDLPPTNRHHRQASPQHVGFSMPPGAHFPMTGPMSPGLDELPEPPASSYVNFPAGANGGADTPPVGGDSPDSSAAATPGGTEKLPAGGRAAPLTDSQKRSNHILSEQKRRNAIRSGFKDLVDFLVAGEAASGIILGPSGGAAGLAAQQQAAAAAAAAAAQAQADEDAANGKKRKGKGTGRGRGRRGDAGANASKSVVLTRAADYILWLERGNRALELEIERLEAACA